MNLANNIIILVKTKKVVWTLGRPVCHQDQMNLILPDPINLVMTHKYKSTGIIIL